MLAMSISSSIPLHPSGLLVKLFLELQPLMPDIPFAPGIFSKDALQVWVVKAWAEQLSQE